MLSIVKSSAVIGIDAYTVEIEIDASNGLPSYALVGLPDTAVRESRERIFSAIKNSGYKIPPSKIIANLAPADIKKEGSSYDLPLAIGILSATEQILLPDWIKDFIILGELSLDGHVKPVKGILPMAISAREKGIRFIIAPHDNAKEAAVAKNVNIIPVKTLSETVDYINKSLEINPYKINVNDLLHKYSDHNIDFADVKGQDHAKRAIEIAAAGSHNILMQGPPGSGKTMLARRIPTILPQMSLEESLETTKIHSVAGLLPKGKALVAQRPFRSPHHTISDAALVGGGSYYIKPGEVSLAHNGLLFLDELPEFKKTVLENLRQPLEDGNVNICRVASTVSFPSQFMLAVAMNPCPCGHLGDTIKNCRCTQPQIINYQNKVSGPLLDRIDINIDVPSLQDEELSQFSAKESSNDIRKRVNFARKIQFKRFKGVDNIFCNSQMETKQIKTFCKIEKDSQNILKAAVQKLGLSARGYDRILKVARTIADIEKKQDILASHICEAIQYRSLDRHYSG